MDGQLGNSCQVEGELKVGVCIHSDGQALWGIKSFLHSAHGKAPTPLSHEQGVARLQVPRLRCQCPLLHGLVWRLVRPRLVLVVEEPRHHNRCIDRQLLMGDAPHGARPGLFRWRKPRASGWRGAAGTVPPPIHDWRDPLRGLELDAQTRLPSRVMAMVSPYSTARRNSSCRVLASVDPISPTRFWAEVARPESGASRILRVVALADSATLHKAFFDRRFHKETPCNCPTIRKPTASTSN